MHRAQGIVDWIVKFGILLAFAGVLAACGPRIQPLGGKSLTPQLAENQVITADGWRLPIEKWSPPGEPTAVVVALHGFNDYHTTYQEPAAYWSTQGLITYAFDQRGFGGTELAGIWAGNEKLISDVAAVARLVKARHPDLPLYLVGHSMGAAIILASVAGTDPPAADGVVLAAPAVWGWTSLNPFYRSVLWFAAHVMPANRASGRGLSIQASDNIEMLRRLGRDPLIIKETRIDAVYGLVDMMDAGFKAAPALSVPALVLYGERDEVLPRPPVEHVVRSAALRPRVVIYPEGWHMLFRDLQGEVVWRDIAAWIKDRKGPIPSGHERPGWPSKTAAVSD